MSYQNNDLNYTIQPSLNDQNDKDLQDKCGSFYLPNGIWNFYLSGEVFEADAYESYGGTQYIDIFRLGIGYIDTLIWDSQKKYVGLYS